MSSCHDILGFSHHFVDGNVDDLNIALYYKFLSYYIMHLFHIYICNLKIIVETRHNFFQPTLRVITIWKNILMN